MRKTYESPKAEKMDFDYSDAVVASASIECKNYTLMGDGNATDLHCKETEYEYTVKDVY